MTGSQRLALERLHGFMAALAAAGINPGPQKQIDFLRSIAVTHPPSLRALYWTARVTLVLSAGEIEPFDIVFAQWFGETKPATDSRTKPRTQGQPEPAPPASGQVADSAQFGVRQGAGREASHHDIATSGQFAATTAAQHQLIGEIRRGLRCKLPQTRARRRVPARRASTLNLRQTTRSATRTGGEVTRLYWRTRPGHPRRVLVLIDVSGSLRASSPDALRFAHALLREVPRSDAYTFGTRLTRVSAELRDRSADAALAKLSEVVADVNGGTRIGVALEEFLADGRRASLARDAVVIIISDGLERGDPSLMAHAVKRIARLAHRLVWWSPLACDPQYHPVTRGMAAIVDDLDDLVGVRDLRSALAAVERMPALELERGRIVRRRSAPPGRPRMEMVHAAG